MKKKQKIFSATARLADALAGRINSRMRLAEGAFLPLLTHKMSFLLWGRRPSDVLATSDRFPPNLKKIDFFKIFGKF